MIGVYTPLRVFSYVFELKYVVSHYLSLIWSILRAIAALIIVVFSDGTSVVPKDGHRQRKASVSNIVMQVNVVLKFVWIR